MLLKSKPKVLIFLRYYLPGFKSGGPVRSISNLVTSLGDKYDFYIVTSNKDFLEKGMSNLAPGWNLVGKAKVRYVIQKDLSISEIRRLVFEIKPDLLYVNSFFDAKFSILSLS